MPGHEAWDDPPILKIESLYHGRVARSADFVGEIKPVGRDVRPLAGDERDDDQLNDEEEPQDGLSKPKTTREHRVANATATPACSTVGEGPSDAIRSRFADVVCPSR